MVTTQSKEQLRMNKIHGTYVLILNIFFMVIVLWIAYIIYNPVMITKYLKNQWNLEPDLESIMHENVKEKFFSASVDDFNKLYFPLISQKKSKLKNFKHKLYYYTKPGNQVNKLIIDIPGGAFLVAATNLNLYYNMTNLDIDVVSLEYPVLMDATAKHTILYLEEAIDYIIENHKKKSSIDHGVFEIYLVTASAGSYYGTKLINRSKFKNYITKFVGINGYYGHKTVSNEFLKLIETCYLTKTLWNFSDIQQREYDCSPIDSTIQTMLCIGTQDSLKESSLYFSRLTGSNLEICTYEGDHTFYLKWNNTEALRFYRDLEIFLMEI